MENLYKIAKADKASLNELINVDNTIKKYINGCKQYDIKKDLVVKFVNTFSNFKIHKKVF